MTEWMAQADPTKEASTVKKMNERSLLFSSNKTTHYFKKMDDCKWCFENIYSLYKNLMLQIDPLNISCSQKLRYPERTQVLRKSSSLEKVAVPKVTIANANVYNCSSKIFTILNE